MVVDNYQHIRFPELHFIAESFYPLTNISFFPNLPAPGSYHSTLFLSVWFIQITHISENTMFDFICLTYFILHNTIMVGASQVTIVVMDPTANAEGLRDGKISLFLWLKNISLYVYTFPQSTHYLMGTQFIFMFGYCK